MPIDPDDFDKPGPAVTPRPTITPPPIVTSKVNPRPVPQPPAFHVPQSVPSFQSAPSGVGKVLAGIVILILLGIGIWFVASEATKPTPQAGIPPAAPSTESPGTRVVQPSVRQAPQVPRVSIVEPTLDRSATTASVESTTPRISPSFDCAKARTPSEKLICRNNDAASAELGMVAAYNQVMNQLPVDAKTAFQREHYEWFKEFTRTCNALAATGTETDLAHCVVGYLSNHTTQLRQRIGR